MQFIPLALSRVFFIIRLIMFSYFYQDAMVRRCWPFNGRAGEELRLLKPRAASQHWLRLPWLSLTEWTTVRWWVSRQP